MFLWCVFLEHVCFFMGSGRRRRGSTFEQQLHTKNALPVLIRLLTMQHLPRRCLWRSFLSYTQQKNTRNARHFQGIENAFQLARITNYRSNFATFRVDPKVL